MIKADYIFLNGNFYTMRQPDETFEAMAVLNGRIVAVGDTKTIRKIEARQEIDLEGKTILPGFMDTHMHFIMDADDRQKVELLQADSIDDIISRMKAQDSPDASPEEWLVGRSIHVENIKEGRFPDRHELDRISTERPVFLFTYCRHTGMGNTKALELAGIGKGFVPEVEGTVEFEEDGSPSGIIRETAYNRYFSPIMDANLDSAAYRKKLAKKFAPEYSKAGLTTLHSYSTISAEPLEYLYMYLELEEEGLLPFRVRMSSAMPLAKTIGAATGLGSDKIKYAAKKLMVDGSLSSRTAALTEPYSDAPEEDGLLLYTQEELDAEMIDAYRNDMQISVHAIGDRAMDMVLTGIEHTLAAVPDGRKSLRFRIIHDILVRADQIERMKKLPVILDVQPVFLRSWVTLAESRVGKDRMEYFLPFKTFMDNGLIVTGGSDAPVETTNPLVGIQCAVTRQDLTGYPPEGFVPKEALSVYEAVSMYTKNAAYCTNEENILGTLEEGKLADFIVLDSNIFEIDPHDIHKLKVLRTVVGGDTVYQAE